jgi:hypothetical protein
MLASNPQPQPSATPAASAYDYLDETGRVLFQILRSGSHEASPRQQKRRGRWESSLDGVRRVLFRLPYLATAAADQPIFVVPDEPAAEALARLGLVATTSLLGLGEWHAEYSPCLRGRRVFILPDPHDADRRHARLVAAALDGIAQSVQVVEVPDPSPGRTVRDWLATGQTRADLLRLTETASALPPAEKSDPQPLPDANPWEPPIPLSELPPVEPFPIDIFPQRLVGFIAEATTALGCPPDYLAVPMLVLAGAAVGASRRLEVKPGHHESAALYAVVVGPPGSAKSPALQVVSEPFYDEESRRQLAYRQARTDFENDPQSHPRPVLESVYISDVTTERLAAKLLEAPRGLVIIRDESTAWVASLDQYRPRGKGSDKQFFLSAWSAAPISVERKHQTEPLCVRHPFLALIGGIPPDLLNRLRVGQKVSDGFLDRILFAFPDAVAVVGENWRGIPGAACAAWRDTLAALWQLAPEAGADGKPWPRSVTLTVESREAWQAFTEQLAAERNREDFPPHLQGPWAKFKGYGARLALILQTLRWACQETSAQDVDGESMARAVRLVAYFGSQARKTYATMEADSNLGGARKILDWLAAHASVSAVTRAALYRPLRGYFKGQPRALDAPLQLLVQHGYLRVHRCERTSPGRKADPFAVNPLWLR